VFWFEQGGQGEMCGDFACASTRVARKII